LFLTTFQQPQMLKPMVAGTYEESNTATTPSAWSIDQSKVRLNCPCDQAYTFDFRYKGKFALSVSAPTNWLLTEHPNIYLFATLVEAHSFIENVQAATLWGSRLQTAIDDAVYKESLSKAVATLSTEVAAMQQDQTFNIYRGC
jgi:hypothetical protein